MHKYYVYNNVYSNFKKPYSIREFLCIIVCSMFFRCNNSCLHEEEEEEDENKTRSRHQPDATSTANDDLNGIISKPSDFVETISRAKIRSVQQTVVIILAYIISSAPFIFCQLWAVWGQPSAEISKSSH